MSVSEVQETLGVEASRGRYRFVTGGNRVTKWMSRNAAVQMLDSLCVSANGTRSISEILGWADSLNEEVLTLSVNPQRLERYL